MRRFSLFICFWILTCSVMAQIMSTEGIELNKSVKDTYVDSVWGGVNLPQSFTGKNVIIGIMDWGFDYSHPVFYDTSMTHYRVLRAWDQYRQSGPTPTGFDYGTEIIGQTDLLAAGCDTFNVYEYGYHGTHVGGIAGGSGAGTPYRGVAFDADLIFTTFLISEQAVVDAFDWMYNVAQQEGKRLVINMSWGLYYMDNFTGSGMIGQKMEELSALGVVFVTSAGNNGDINFHLKHNFETESDTLTSIIGFTAGSPYQYGERITMTNSENSPFAFSMRIMNNSYAFIGKTPFYNTANGNQYIDTNIVIGNDTLSYIVIIEEKDANNLRSEVSFIVKKPASGYKLALQVTAEHGEFHAWNVIELTNGVGNWGGFFSAPSSQPTWKIGDANYGIGTPANVDCAISVAAYQPRVVTPTVTVGGAIADFSSYGPTIDGRTKPEISAPGKGIISSISSFTNQYSGSYTTTVNFMGKEYKFASLSGTSMASPFCAGIVALILQANPYLSSSQIKQILMQTARSDNYTAEVGITQCGAGKIDAYQAILLALQTTGIEEITFHESEFSLFPNPSTGILHITAKTNEGSALMEIYDITGKKLTSNKLYQGVNSFEYGMFQSGYYLIKIIERDRIKILKWIKN